MGEVIRYRKKDIANWIWKMVLLCAVMILMVIPNRQMEKSMFSSLLDIVCPKMEVQAGAVDANGYTVATDLSGIAYSVFSETNSTLYIVRNSNTSLAVNSSYPSFSDPYNNITVSDGIVWKKNIEQNYAYNVDAGDSSYLAGNSSTVANKVQKIIFIGDVRPVKTSLWCKDMKSLTSIVGMESHLDTSKVTDMGHMFSGCSSITAIDVSKFNTSNTHKIAYMFKGCSKITSLDVSNFNTSNMDLMYNVFDSCSSLTSPDLSNFDTSKVTNMRYMFYGCSKITSLNVSRFDTSNVTSMKSMFSGCSKLTSLDLSGFDTSKVTDMGNMFYSCSSLTSLDVSGFDTGNVTSMYNMFSGCSALTSLDVSGFDTGNVTSMCNMFSGCSSLTSLDVSGFDTSNVIDMSYMFYCCGKLISLNLLNFDTNQVINMQYMFYGCAGLTFLDVSNFNTKKVQTMECMFINCWNLSSLDVSNFDTSNVVNMNSMFNNCQSLISIDLSNFDTSKVTNMKDMFYEPVSSKLHTISLGAKTVLSSDCSLSTPSNTSKYTGKWTLSDPYNHTGQLSSSELIAKTQETGGAPGLWTAERTGADPKAQGYTSISANIYDATLHTNPDGTVKSDEDPVSLFRTDEGGSGYWQKLADNRWAYTFFVYKNDEVNWRVWEDNVSGYTGNYTIANPLDIAGSDIQKGEQPVITNTKNNKPLTGTLSLAKKTVSSDGSAFATDQSFTFTIALTGDSISGSQVFGDTPFANGIATVSLKNGESISFTDIPSGTAYQISEAQADGFTGSIDKPSGTIPYNGSVAVTCTNTKQNQTKDYVSLTVTKKVVSNADESSTKFSFHASFTGLEVNTTYQTSDGASFSSDADGNANADFRLSGGQSITFQKIPAGAKYIITEDGGEYLPSYKITDSAGVNKIVSSSGKSVQTDTDLSTSRETADKGENVQITFTNEITRTQDIVLTKSSVKSDGTANTSDTDQYIVDVYISGLTGKQKIKTSNGILTADDDGIIETGMYISSGQKITFFDVPVGAKYKFTEEANSKIPSYKITNDEKVEGLTGYKSVSEIKDDAAALLDGKQGTEYTTQNMTKHAHTANISDDGASSGSYNNSVNYSSATTATVDGKTVSENLQTVTIPGADSISVDVTYQTESTSYDWLYIYKGTVTRSSAADSGTAGSLAKSGKIGGSTKTTLDTITVPGDTVTFVWRTDGSGNNYYGYYATVSGVSKQQTPVSLARTDTGIRLTKNGSSTDYLFMKASTEIRDSKAQIRLDFYDDPEGSPADTVYLDTGITEAQYNAMDTATRDDTVLKSLSTKSTANIVSASGENTEANTTLATAEETVDAGENITVAFTNKSPNAAKLKVIKYDSSSSKKKIGGAEFALYKSDGTPVNFTADGKNIITIGSNGESDLLESPLFVPGSYYLTETKAPDGYTVSGEPKVFEITADDAGKTLQIEVYDNKLVVFPVTGGKGNGKILSIALVLATAAGSALIYKKRRKAAA